MKRYLNLGCGLKYNNEWENADIAPRNKCVKKVNFLNGLPYSDNSFDVVYHSHVLEHMCKRSGADFICECVRVLKQGGVIRIATPNLERIATEYLDKLNNARQRGMEANSDYDWILLEMYDQTVRNYPGGMMGDYLQNPAMDNPEYVRSRIGFDPQTLQTARTSGGLRQKTKDFLKHLTSNYSRNVFLRPFVYYLVGKYRYMGEVHLWLYDSYSLTRLLTQAGCHKIEVRNATESYIENWANFHLDNPNETASIFIEAMKL